MNLTRRLLPAVILVLLLTSCESIRMRSMMKSLQSTEIVLPETLTKFDDGSFRRMPSSGLSGPKMVIFIDSTNCSTCRLSKLVRYLPLEEKSAGGQRFRLVVLLSMKKGESSTLKDWMKNTEMPVPVYIDDGNEFRDLNPSIPEDVRFHSFFLDGNGKPLMIGDPSGSVKLMSMLDGLLDAGTQASDKAEVDIFRFYLKKACMDAAQIGVPQLRGVMADEGIDTHTWKDVSGLFVPSNVCRECLSGTAAAVAGIPDLKDLIIVAPDSLALTVKSLFPEAGDVLTYESKRAEGSDIENFEGAICFHIGEGIVDDVYLSNNEVPEATEAFFEKYVY